MNVSVAGWLAWRPSAWVMAALDWLPRSQNLMRRHSDGGAESWLKGFVLSSLVASDRQVLDESLWTRIPPPVQQLMMLVDPEIAGDPVSDLRWIRRSLRKLERALKRSGVKLGRTAIRSVLLAYGIRPKANVKHLTPRPHRDRQFQSVLRWRRRFERAGWPIISVDTKKKELIGLFKNAGQIWTDRAPEVYTYDFPNDALAKATPYGIFDVQANAGAMYIGLDGDTPDFAVDAIVHWWRQVGQRRYLGAGRLLILADGGGSNGYRPRRWKTELQRRLVDPFGLTVTICHYPPGASKWNPIEHRLFSQISQTWAGLPLMSLEVMLSAIRSTTTRTGLRVTAHLMPGGYPRKRTASAQEWAQLRIKRDPPCPLWSYTLSPSKSGK